MFGNCDKDKKTPLEECQKILNFLRQGKIKKEVFILKVQNIVDQTEPELVEKLIDFLDGQRILVSGGEYHYYVVRIREDGKTIRLDKYA